MRERRARGRARVDAGRRGSTRDASTRVAVCARERALVCVRARVSFFYASYGALTLGFRVSFARAVITEVTPK